MQLFGLVNTLLANSRLTAEKDLSIQRYAVIPLSPNSGLIGWVPNCDTLHHLIREYRDARKVCIQINHYFSFLQMSSIPSWQLLGSESCKFLWTTVTALEHSNSIVPLFMIWMDVFPCVLSKQVPVNVEHRLMLAFAPDYERLTLMAKVEVFEHALENSPGNDLAKVC